MSNRQPLTVLGQVIGTHDGWEENNVCSIMIYKFTSAEQFKSKLPPGDFLLDYNDGIIEYDDENIHRVSILDLFK